MEFAKTFESSYSIETLDEFHDLKPVCGAKPGLVRLHDNCSCLFLFMAKFNIDVPHGQDRDAVVAKLRSFFKQALDDAPDAVSEVEETWDEQGNLAFAFSAMGFRVAGNMVTDEEKIIVGGDLPFAAMPFRGALESQIKERLQQAIA